MRVVLLDKTCPKPYDTRTLATEAMGGTEATVVRVAEALADRGHEVIVAQHNRRELGEGKAAYVPWEALDHIHHTPHAAIALRDPRILADIKDRWSTRSVLWCHDLNQTDLVRASDLLKSATVVAVSNFHATQIKTALLSQLPEVPSGCLLRTIYNPVDLEPDETPVLHRKLVFFSSPHKGLDHALYLFARLRAVDPTYTLHVANPGYLRASVEAWPDGVRDLGAMPWSGVIAHVRSALCVFHPNLVFPETFGLVHAEANAVGTPCLTSYLGANSEVLNPASQQMLDVRNEKAVIDRILKWGEERPVVRGKPEFKIENVIKQWEEVLK